MRPVMKNLKEKKIRLSASRGKRLLYYFIAGLLLSLLVLAGTMMGAALDLHIVPELVKLVLAGLSFLLAWQSGYIAPGEDGAIRLPLVLVCLAPLLMLFLYIGPVQGSVTAGAVLFLLLGAFSTAAWEELYFRLWGRILFEENEKYRVGEFVLAAVIFGSMHFVNLAVSDVGSVLMQVAYAVITGVFLQTVYAVGKSLRLVVLYHFLNNLLLQLFTQLLTPDASARYLGRISAYTPLLIAFYLALAAALLTRQHQLFGKTISLFSRKGRKA